MTSHPDAEFIAVQAALAGEYSLDCEIGRGGMGIVYLAREARLARQVAIKVLPPALAERPDLRASFLREAQVVARLNHPNIVPVHAAGERGGFVYMVMAYVDGITLAERVRTRGPLQPGQAARVMREVAWALGYAHGAGIVHRDVSADNILLERGTDRAIVMDFGIASAMQTAAVTDDGRVMGNAHYISPEQAVGEPVDGRSDIYSLGVCGFLALTGRLPFDGATPEAIVNAHLTKPAPSISSAVSVVPPRLAAAVEKCLAKDPILRYRNAESFAEAIDLAFEHAREIPTALRVWISQGEQESGPRAMLVTWGLVVGSLASVIQDSMWFVPVGALGFGAISCIPILMRLRRVLKQGYVVEDLHVALREHDLLRTEELRYVRQFSSAPLSPALQVLLVASSSSWVVQTWLNKSALSTLGGGGATFIRSFIVVTTFAAVSTLALAGRFLKSRLATPLSNLKVAFWKSSWGERLAKVAGIGLAPVQRAALSSRQLTEVALGRATDHLFRALPAAVRRELSDLPQVVQRLEHDATALRASIDLLDAQITLFERTRGGNTTAGSSSDDEDNLRGSRLTGIERLSATIAALENIRLDLLRLQMGSTGIESVTASLEAAQRVSVRIAQAIDAQQEVEQWLRDEPRRLPSTLPETHTDVDDDADTPVEGVPAASV
jgi:serine/threonine protein kinase